MSNREELITALSSELKSVKPAVNIDFMAIAWLLGSALYVAGITHWFGPIRPNALSQLATEPRFLMETVSGILAIAFTSVIAFRTAVPGALTTRFAAIGFGLMLLWLANYMIGLVSPALEPSMLGKRDHCFLETFLYATPPAFVAFVLTRRLYPLRPVYTAMAFSLAAGMIPALYMQIACMYMPAHILQFHILPGLAVVILGALVAWLTQRQRRR